MPLSDNLMSVVSPELLGSLASRLGESQDAIQTGLKASAASLLGTMAAKAGDYGFLEKIIGFVTSKANDPAILSDLSGLASGHSPEALKELGGQLLATVFGSAAQQSAAANVAGQTAGLKGSSAASLMTMAAPMVLAILGKQAGSNPTPSSLGGLLSAELPALGKVMPASLATAAAASTSPQAPKAAAAHTGAHEEPETTSTGGAGWVLPALVGLILLGALFWWFFQSKPAPEVASKPAETAPVSDSGKAMWAALGEFSKRKLPDGVELNIPKLGVENKLIDFIEDPSKPVDKETWFDFDRLLFDTGKSTLQPASQEQLTNIAAILKAYPKVHVRLGGYTDNVGDKTANQKLSEDRASNVMGELEKLGVGKGRLDAKGYGEEHPVAANDTEEGRAKNRRISMRVTAK